MNSGRKGLLFALPWIVGLGLFTLYPLVASIYYSFTHFSVLQAPKFIGIANYTEMATDGIFWLALWNTFVYAGLSIPLGLVLSLALAILVNSVKRGQVLYSVIFYIPELIPGVVAAIVWLFIFGGLLNGLLDPVFDAMNWVRRLFDPNLKELWRPPVWLGSTTWALPSLVLMGLWTVGQTAFIYLAKLQDVPQELYEAAEIDGATPWQKVWFVTLPMISPIILFNTIMSIIGAFQVFTQPYIMTNGGPDNATMFVPQYIWESAFVTMRMGYACAMSWILFLVIAVLTVLAFKISKDRVYYAGR
ncbi:MAG TPA: sugar ABC transporter permease [Planctomycetota bacterium]|nr:sugar ABC transporter permease [Planctomycetota bacterium]